MWVRTDSGDGSHTCSQPPLDRPGWSAILEERTNTESAENESALGRLWVAAIIMFGFIIRLPSGPAITN